MGFGKRRVMLRRCHGGRRRESFRSVWAALLDVIGSRTGMLGRKVDSSARAIEGDSDLENERTHGMMRGV